MKDDSWSNHYKSCWMSRGMLLSFQDDSIAQLIAQKLMTSHGINSVFLGKQESSHFKEGNEVSGVEITTYIKTQVPKATLLSGTFSYSFVSGYEKEGAICEFGS